MSPSRSNDLGPDRVRATAWCASCGERVTFVGEARDGTHYMVWTTVRGKRGPIVRGFPAFHDRCARELDLVKGAG